MTYLHYYEYKYLYKILNKMDKENSVLVVEVEDINDAIGLFNDIRMLKKQYKIKKLDIYNKQSFDELINKNEKKN
tara:strand:+ start:1868 stop:2092 length:225 start_codon:yes stop_codon:yes gene_type:complete